jgi:gamma-glutamyltranspeptidase
MTSGAHSRFGVVASADGAATQAGMHMLALGGNAVDAALATNAAMAVVAPHLCGMGGDLFALVHANGQVHALDAAGRAGSGVSARQLRDEGHREMPFHGDLRTVTVPGAVAGWAALHERFGTLPLATIFAPAIRLAEEGFAASPLLVGSLALLKPTFAANFAALSQQATTAGSGVRREGLGRTLRNIATGGPAAFYLGEFGEGLLAMGKGVYSPTDFSSVRADWVTPLTHQVWGHHVWSIPAPSQGYLFISSLPRDLIEAARVDGASHLRIFVSVVMPLSVPAFASLGIFQFLWTWNDYLVGYVFAGGKNGPMTVKLVELAGNRGNEWQRLTAAAFVTMVIPLLVFASLQRYFVRGLIAGAVKG